MFLLIQTILNHSRQKQGVKFPPPAFCQLRPMLFSSPPSNIQKPLPVGDVSISPTDSGFACIYFSYK